MSLISLSDHRGEFCCAADLLFTSRIMIASNYPLQEQYCECLTLVLRVRAMLAMRACRSSIMIGKTLDRRSMRKTLDHLADLDSPWNCPHGRPTMRHLAVLPHSM